MSEDTKIDTDNNVATQIHEEKEIKGQAVGVTHTAPTVDEHLKQIGKFEEPKPTTSSTAIDEKAIDKSHGFAVYFSQFPYQMVQLDTQALLEVDGRMTRLPAAVVKFSMNYCVIPLTLMVPHRKPEMNVVREMDKWCAKRGHAHRVHPDSPEFKQKIKKFIGLENVS